MDGSLGDGGTLRAGALGMTLILRSLRDKLLTLSDDVVVIPGHGPETTIGEERAENPLV
jgi:glyoxylase-like metal-dependent hydrolase (beta-lactamase superfamily II)